PSQVVRVDRRAEAVFDGIRNRDRVIEILRLQDAEDGPENLLQGKALMTVDGEDRRGDEEPLVVGASSELLPACDEGVPLLPADLDVLEDFFLLVRRGHRTHVRLLV